MTSQPLTPAVFLDRDKTLIEDPGYISEPDQVRLLAGAADALARLRAAGYAVVVATNQSGVARGLLTEEGLARIHQRMRDLLRAQGADVDAVYYCPYLDGPEAVREGYRRDSDLRKPKPGMLLLAAQELGLDLARSWMIGDSPRDIQAGLAAGCRTIFVSSAEEAEDVGADFLVSNLAAAAEHILQCGEAPVMPESAEEQTRREMTAAANLDRDAIPPTAFQPPSPSTAERMSAPPTPERPQPRTAGQSPAGAAPAASSKPIAAAPHGESPADARVEAAEETLTRILEELHAMRRERQYADFSIAKLIGAVAEAFAISAVAWGLYRWMGTGAGPDPEGATSATIWLLAGIAFQLMALTCLSAANRR